MNFEKIDFYYNILKIINLLKKTLDSIKKNS